MGVDLRRRQAAVPEKLLDAADVGPAVEKMGREAVPQRVGAGVRCRGPAAFRCFSSIRARCGSSGAIEFIDKHRRIGVGGPVAAEHAKRQPAAERVGGVGPEWCKAFALAADANHAGAEVEIAVVDADKLADPEAGRVHGLQNRAVAQSERLIRRRGLKQAPDVFRRKEVGQGPALPRIPQRLAGVVVDPALALAETVEAAEAGQPPGDRRLGIARLVQRSDVAAQLERRDLAGRRALPLAGLRDSPPMPSGPRGNS